jgi:hypothetical protein
VSLVKAFCIAADPLDTDGGDLRAVSQLVILDEFMRRVEWDTKASGRILPCEYFHMMAGVGTGG